MNDGGSIVEFFYNIVPGILSVLVFQYFSKVDLLAFMPQLKLQDNVVLVIFVYVILGLFLGFVFQSITKAIRDNSQLNDWIANKVIKSNENEFKSVYKRLNKDYPKSSPLPNVQAFYLMDNYLRGERPAFLPTHNSARFAFWSNIFCAILILLILLFKYSCQNTIFYCAFGIIISGYNAYRYFYAYYDTILKSYYMRTEFNKS